MTYYTWRSGDLTIFYISAAGTRSLWGWRGGRCKVQVGHTQVNPLVYIIWHISRQFHGYNIVNDDWQVEINEMSKIWTYKYFTNLPGIEPSSFGTPPPRRTTHANTDQLKSWSHHLRFYMQFCLLVASRIHGYIPGPMTYYIYYEVAAVRLSLRSTRWRSWSRVLQVVGGSGVRKYIHRWMS